MCHAGAVKAIMCDLTFCSTEIHLCQTHYHQLAGEIIRDLPTGINSPEYVANRTMQLALKVGRPTTTNISSIYDNGRCKTVIYEDGRYQYFYPGSTRPMTEFTP